MSTRPLSARLLLVGQLALVAAVLAQQFPHWWAQRWVQDDAYVSFRYARNLVRGEGLVYNPGQPVEGYTNFLWTVLAALPLAAGAEDPLPAMHALSAVLWAVSFALLTALGVALWARGLWAAPLAVVPLAYHWSFNLWSFSGMETPLVTACLIAAVCAVALAPERHAWAPAAASACAVALVMTRPDGIVVLAALALAVVALDGAAIVRARRWRRGVLWPALPILLVLAPYQLWRLWYYGSFYPNTYYAKAAYLPYYARGVQYLTVYLSIYRLGWFLPLLVGAGLVRDMPVLARRFLVATSLTALAVGFYVVRLGGDFMEWRFLTPVSGVLYPALVIAACVLGRHLPRRAPAAARAWLGFAAGAAGAALLTWTTIDAAERARTRMIPDQETIPLLRRYTDPGRFDWRTAARAFDAVLPPETRIATTSAGIVPYFCDRPCLDLHGLTDPLIARVPVFPNTRGRMGHEHWVNEHVYIRGRGVDVILEWADPNPYPRSATTPPADGAELVSVRLDDGRYVDFTLLNPALRPRLTDPRLVFHEPAALADAGRRHQPMLAVAGWEVIDQLDWGDEADEARHQFRESQAADAPYGHSWHTKLLAYLPPRDTVRLEDDGRRIHGSAEWVVDGVRADRDLAVVARIDHTGGGIYDLEINGHPAPEPLVTPWRPDEWWGEVRAVIPAELLRAGPNDLRLVRRAAPDHDAEFYRMWFLQPREPAG